MCLLSQLKQHCGGLPREEHTRMTSDTNYFFLFLVRLDSLVFTPPSYCTCIDRMQLYHYCSSTEKMEGVTIEGDESIIIKEEIESLLAKKKSDDGAATEQEALDT